MLHRVTSMAIVGSVRHLEQLKAQVADPGGQAVQGRLVGDRPGDGGLAGLVAGDPQALEPGRPAGVQHALDAELVARRLGWSGACWWATHPASRAMMASRMAAPEDHSATLARWRAARAQR